MRFFGKKILAALTVLAMLSAPLGTVRVASADEASSTDAEDATAGDAFLNPTIIGKDIEVLGGISVEGVDISGLTYKDALDIVTEKVSAKRRGQTVTFKSSYGDTKITLEECGYTDDAEEIVAKALMTGNSGSLYKRYMDRESIGEGMDLKLTADIDDASVGQAVSSRLGSRMYEGCTYSLNENGDGTVSVSVDGEAKAVDSHESAENIREKLSDDWDGSGITAELVLTDNSSEQQGQLGAIRDLLGEFSTNYVSAAGRMKNVEKAAGMISGTVVYPGEMFSTNEKICPITLANGYFTSIVFQGNKSVEGVGGGVCQVSTTLYDAVLRAELEIGERKNHGMMVHYVKPGEDATITEGIDDFTFKNSLNDPIYIQAICAGGILTFRIYGKEYRPANRTLEFESRILETLSPSGETITEDPAKPEGYRAVTSGAKTGYRAELWKHIYIDGELSESVQINSSNYRAVPAEVTVGTGSSQDDTPDEQPASPQPAEPQTEAPAPEPQTEAPAPEPQTEAPAPEPQTEAPAAEETPQEETQ